MGKLLITKVFTLDFAHALDGYDGPCRNIHGHTYHLEITVLGRVCLKECSTNGMVMDFKLLKNLVQTEITDVFDHSLVLNGTSQNHIQYAEALQSEFKKIVLLNCQPTCENLLLEFKQRLESKIKAHGAVLYHIRLQETPTSSATWNYHINEIDIPL